MSTIKRKIIGVLTLLILFIAAISFNIIGVFASPSNEELYYGAFLGRSGQYVQEDGNEKWEDLDRTLLSYMQSKRQI